jgi:hypothetical protein
MSLRIRAILIAFQMSALIWALAITGAVAVYSQFNPEIDTTTTASTQVSVPAR